MIYVLLILASVIWTGAVASGAEDSANRLSYLDAPIDPYYVGLDFPRLVTPQWVGDQGVEAVVVLAIDDMRDTAHYEAFLRPILDRLKQHQSRASLSIMTNQVEPQDAQLQSWIREGVNIDVHTIDHPCPLLCESDLDKARQTYDRCIDLMSTIPNNHPTAFRMPCCDSMNTPSPRFYESVFERVTAGGNYLTIDSSVFNITTASDSSLPTALTRDSDGRPRFRKYLPFRSFVNTIEDYPYPYVIGRLCWEFPCIVPSDWEAQNLHQPNNPKTVKDLQAALDVVVRKQGVMNLVFHPHGWIRNDQVAQLIDYATQTYGSRVLFLNFREAQQRLDRHLLDGHPLRNSQDGNSQDGNPQEGDSHGADNGVRMLDINADGYLDVVRHDKRGSLSTRRWQPESQQWKETSRPCQAKSIHFGVGGPEGRVSMLAVTDTGLELSLFDGEAWQPQEFRLAKDGLSEAWRARLAKPTQLDAVRWRDLDQDGQCELLLAQGTDSLILHNVAQQPTSTPTPTPTSASAPTPTSPATSPAESSWRALPFGLPTGVRLATDRGKDAGLRWIDLDGDGQAECVFSDPQRFSAHRWVSLAKGWKTLVDGPRDQLPADAFSIPPFIRPDGSNNGVWAHSRHLWWQNEDTARLPDKVDRLALADIHEPLADANEADTSEFPGPLEPRDALKAFRSSVNAKIELMASEPLIADPVAFDWAPDGRLFVVEMSDYPEDEDRPDPRRGRVRVLFDDDQDGRYDRAETFLDDLHFPTGVKVWRDGVLVSGAPNIIFARDTDGDQRADETKVLYEGFGEGNQQHRVNGLRFGIDNWLYIANGDSGGRVRSFAGGEPVNLSGRDLRIDPDSGRMETISGRTQFGRARDDRGNWFGGNNSDPVWHYLLDDHYLRRNSSFAPPSVHRSIPEVAGPAPIFPTSRTLPRFNDFDRVDRITSACGPLLVRDGGFGPDGALESFVCEPVHNLVHREAVRAEGITFRSRRLPIDRAAEFLASTDNWFRPVLLRVGPHGGIWVADMYRLVIEHPTWIPIQWQQQLNVRAGNDRGRLYRLLPKGQSVPGPFPRLDRLTTAGLVKRLDHANRWQRDMAHQMLLWRADVGAIEPLRQLVHHARHPVAKMQALYVLDRLNAVDAKAVDAEWLADVVRGAEPAVARHAIVLAELRMAQAPRLLDAVLSRVGTDDRPLQLQLAYSLGYSRDPRASDALAALALREPIEPVIQAAVMSSLTRNNIGRVLASALRQGVQKQDPELYRELLGQALSLGERHVHVIAMQSLLNLDAKDNLSWRFRTLAKLIAQYLERHDNTSELPSEVSDALIAQVEQARQVADDDDAELDLRLAAIGLLQSKLDPNRHNRDVLQRLLAPRQPPEIQADAGGTLLRQFADAAVPSILSGWNGFSPRTRNRLLSELLRRTDLTITLLEAAQREQLDLHLDARRRQQLLDSNNERVRAIAETLFAIGDSASRQALVDQYRPPTDFDADIQRGRKTFKRVCATCHQFSEMGSAVGPNLESLGNKSVDFLLTAILDPNRAVESTYMDFHIETSDGRQFTGILQGETANSVTLLAADAKQQAILRRDIEMMHATGKSLMPDGLEKDITVDEMHHLLALLRSYKPSRKQFDGNRPQIAPRRNDGTVRLLAIHAEIFGPSLVFEPQYRNLGFWGDAKDFAAWTIELPEAGKYSVAFEYACDPNSSGNRFVMIAPNGQVNGEVKSTGKWDAYRWEDVGTIQLPAGRTRMVVRPEGTVRGYLMDLHQILLQPVD